MKKERQGQNASLANFVYTFSKAGVIEVTRNLAAKHGLSHLSLTTLNAIYFSAINPDPVTSQGKHLNGLKLSSKLKRDCVKRNQYTNKMCVIGCAMTDVLITG